MELQRCNKWVPSGCQLFNDDLNFNCVNSPWPVYSSVCTWPYFKAGVDIVLNDTNLTGFSNVIAN